MQPLGHCQGEAGLDGTARSRQCDEAELRIGKAARQDCDLALPPDQSGWRDRQRPQLALPRPLLCCGRTPCRCHERRAVRRGQVQDACNILRVSLRGTSRAPRSRSLMPRMLSPARSANASCVSPLATRARRSRSPNAFSVIADPAATELPRTTQSRPSPPRARGDLPRPMQRQTRPRQVICAALRRGARNSPEGLGRERSRLPPAAQPPRRAT